MPASGQSARSALHRDTFKIAVSALPRHWSVFEREAHVIRDKQVQVTVAVVVQETASRPPARLFVPKTDCLGYIGKRAVSAVAIKMVLTIGGEKDILKSIIVVVANADARRPTNGLHAGFFRNISEGTVAIVLIK